MLDSSTLNILTPLVLTGPILSPDPSDSWWPITALGGETSALPGEVEMKSNANMQDCAWIVQTAPDTEVFAWSREPGGQNPAKSRALASVSLPRGWGAPLKLYKAP